MCNSYCKLIFLTVFISRRKQTTADLEGEFIRTTITRLKEEEGVSFQISGHDEYGFFINNKIRVVGPLIIFPKAIYSWNVSGIQEINKNSLALFAMLEPKPGFQILISI